MKPKIGKHGYAKALELGARSQGVVIPEIAEAFKVGDDCARRFVLRLVREGAMKRTRDRRRRPHAVEWCRGAGGVVYRTKEVSCARSSRRRSSTR